MFVKRVKIDGDVTLCPSWEFVRQAILSLNGGDRCDIAMDGHTEEDATCFPQRIRPPSLLISGKSLDGLVYMIVDIDCDSFELRTPSNAGREVQMTIGGTDVWIPADRCATLEAAIEAVRYFFDHGKISPHPNWHRL